MSGINLAEHTTKFGGKPYVMVSGRVLLAHEANEELSITTDIVGMTEDYVIVKASVSTMKGVFTGHATSYTRTGSPQERKTPLEVAETSAIGRALGFAGYALEHGIASADEMSRVQTEAPQPTAAPQKPAKAQKPAPVVEGAPIPTPSELQARYNAAAEEGKKKGVLAQMQVAKHEIDPSGNKGIDHLAPVQQWRVVEALEGVLAGA
jgi:type IV secretory pathway VirB10-like protein